MLTSVIPYYQQKLQWALFRSTTLAYCVFGIINLLRYLQEPQWTRIAQSLAFFMGALIAWQCATWIQRGYRVHLAKAVGIGGLVLVQLIYRLIYGAPNGGLMNFGDSLSVYLAQIGRFGSFHTDQKPWPFADWPAPRAPEGEAPYAQPVRETKQP